MPEAAGLIWPFSDMVICRLAAIYGGGDIGVDGGRVYLGMDPGPRLR
jgi:hypothetical protein